MTLILTIGLLKQPTPRMPSLRCGGARACVVSNAGNGVGLDSLWMTRFQTARQPNATGGSDGALHGLERWHLRPRAKILRPLHELPGNSHAATLPHAC